MTSSPDPDFKLTGGPRPAAQEDAARKLRERLILEDDVFRIVDLAPAPGGPPGRWLYCIETPFATYPRYAVGTTDESLSEVRILSLHSAEWGATGSFEKALKP